MAVPRRLGVHPIAGSSSDLSPMQVGTEDQLRNVQERAGLGSAWREDDVIQAQEAHKETIMRVHLSTAAAGFLLLAGIGAAAAQDVIIAPEQETVIKEYVKKQPLASVKIPGVELNIGSPLPDTVELHEVPNVKYRYVVVDNRTVLVDPGTRKIVKIIE